MEQKQRIIKSRQKKANSDMLDKWYQTLMYLNIPIFSFFYLIKLSKGKTDDPRTLYAKARLKIKVRFFLLTLVVFVILFFTVGIKYFEILLDYLDKI